jgi:hypothetical protein
MELYGCHQSVGHLVALLVAVIGPLDVFTNGDDPTRSCIFSTRYMYYGIAMNMVSADRPKKALYAVSKLATSNCIISVQKFN